MNEYNDIVNLERPISKYPKASINSRSAQFAPFAALVGYEDCINEAKRLTESKIELTQEDIDRINKKLYLVKDSKNFKIELTYFVKDAKKDGGYYHNYYGFVKKIDIDNQLVIIDKKLKIKFKDILYIR